MSEKEQEKIIEILLDIFFESVDNTEEKKDPPE
jgi:hypothetical protein